MDKDKFKLVVKVHTEHEHREEENIDYTDRYTHLEDQKGYALLVSFPTNCEGSVKDVKNIEGVLKELNFKVEHCKDPTRTDLNEKLEETAAILIKDWKWYHCFALFITGHGTESGVETADSDSIPAKKIVSHFKNGFVGKPKLFFIESCRGDECQMFNRQLFTEVKSDGILVPVDGDILIAHSTTKGCISMADNDGSLFIKTCVDVFRKDYKKMHVEEMMIEIKAKMAPRKFKKEEIDLIFGQMPCTWSTLRKKVFF